MNYDNNNRKRSRQQADIFSIDLQMNLLNTWLKHQVGEYYQNIFLAHLDELPPKMVEEKVKKQIKNTLQKRTYFYTIEDLNNQRQGILIQLQQILYNFPKDANQDDLSLVYNKMKIVREINLEIAETIIRMHQGYHCQNKQLQNRQLKEYICLIDQLQESVAFIKESQLKNYMKFGQGFDPFFVNYYQQAHRQQGTKSALKQFYTLNISYVYRLMKAKSKLVDMRSAYQQPPPFKRRQKQTYKFQSLPTLNTEHYNGKSKQSENSRNRISVPIMVSSYKRQRSSRTTIYPSYEERPDSSYTEKYNKQKMMLSKVMDYADGNESKQSMRSKRKKNSVYLHQSKRQVKKYHLNHDQNDLQIASYRHQRQYSVPDESSYKLQPISHSKNVSNDGPKSKKTVELKPYHVGTTVEPDKVIQIKNYNPVKRQSFQITHTPRSNNKYDYIPQQNINLNPNTHQQLYQNQRQGLQYQSPLSKYKIKSKLTPKQINKQVQKPKPKPSVQRIDKQIQTIQLKQSNNKSQQRKQPAPKVENNKPKMQEIPQKTQQKPKKLQIFRDKDDETIEDEDIIDERPDYRQQSSKKPLIRQVNKQQYSPTNNNPVVNSQKRQQQPSNLKQNQEKKEIKMKVGKLTLKQVLQLLQNIKILPNYQIFFDMQKLIPWLKTSQTYLTQFHINDKCAIVALASPIPNMGTAIKLWAPINGIANEAISMNLFPRYIQYIQKTTTADKILYNGNGGSFKELNASGFTMRKQNAYERLRKLPPKATQSEFKPFLYVQCSIVNFPQNSKQSMIYSQEIEQFSQKNCYLAKFLGQIDVNRIPQPSKNLIKISENLPNFKEVNKILVHQAFDQYQASQIKATNIKLLRLYLNSPLRSTFLAGDGFLKFVGNLIYQDNQKCLISVNTLKNNGVMYFSKNMSFDAILQKSKIASTTRVNFCVKMFTKKLYGKLANFSPGNYGNFQINLTFQDEMQGKIKHNMKVERTFGPQLFTIGVQIDKCTLLCVTVGEDDFIY